MAMTRGHVDAIADLVGGTVLSGALTALRPAGQIAAIAVPELDLGPVLDANITFHGVLIRDDGNRTRRLAALLAEGALRPVVSHLLPLREAAQAQRVLEDGHPGGKIVLSMT
jgi:NADPH:quinone reductase